MSLYAHYDRGSDIALLLLEGAHGANVVSEETEFGLRDVDKEDGRLVGVELWEASTRLPQDLLELMASHDAYEA